MPGQVSHIDNHLFVRLYIKLLDEMITCNTFKSFQIYAAMNNRNTLCRDTVRYHHIFNFMGNRNKIFGHVPVLDPRKTQKTVSVNGEIHPTGDQTVCFTANRSNKCQGMGVGSVTVEDVILKYLDQISNTVAGDWIGFTPH